MRRVFFFILGEIIFKLTVTLFGARVDELEDETESEFEETSPRGGDYCLEDEFEV